MVYLLDSDMHGVDSIKNFIDAGQIQHLTCPTFQAFSEHVNKLVPVLFAELIAGGDPHVIVDTASQLAHTTRVDHKLGLDPTINLWTKKDQYEGSDKNYLTVYDYATDALIRSLKNLRAIEATFDAEKKYVKNPPSPLPAGFARRSVRVTVNCHEAEQDDVSVGYKKRAPYLNKALYKSLEANCSDMFRLTATDADIYDGETLLYKRDTRFLTLRKNEECVTKFQIQRQYVADLPAVIINPSMRAIWHYLHKKPSLLVIYGPAGVGKTTLAVSELEPVAKKSKANQTNESKEAA